MLAWYLVVSMLVDGMSEDTMFFFTFVWLFGLANVYGGAVVRTIKLWYVNLVFLCLRPDWRSLDDIISSHPRVFVWRQKTEEKCRSRLINGNDPLGCLWTTSKGLERARPESSGPPNTIFIFSSFFFQITRYPSSVSSLLWFPFQIYLISRLRRPPRVLSLFHHNIQSSVALCVISAASALVVCVCVWETPHHQPIIRISADDPAWSVRKEKQAIVFLDPLLLFFFVCLSPPQWTRAVAAAFTLWAKRANSSIYMYVCKTSFHSAIKTKQMKLSCFVNLSLLLRPQNPSDRCGSQPLCCCHAPPNIRKWQNRRELIRLTKEVRDLSLRGRGAGAGARDRWGWTWTYRCDRTTQNSAPEAAEARHQGRYVTFINRHWKLKSSQTLSRQSEISMEALRGQGKTFCFLIWSKSFLSFIYLFICEIYLSKKKDNNSLGGKKINLENVFLLLLFIFSWKFFNTWKKKVSLKKVFFRRKNALFSCVFFKCNICLCETEWRDFFHWIHFFPCVYFFTHGRILFLISKKI